MAHVPYQRSPQGWLLTLAAQQLDMGDMFSAKAQAATTGAFSLVEKLIAKKTKEATK